MRNLVWGALLLLLGVLLLLDNLGIADVGQILHDFWPLLLIIWGVSIIVRRRAPAVAKVAAGGVPAPEAGMPSAGDHLHQSSVVGDIRLHIVSQNFKGGSVSTLFGDAFLDLSGAAFAEGTHELRIHSVFGNTRILLPPGAPVLVAGHLFMGNLTAFGQRRGGVASDLRLESPSYAGSSGRLTITLSKTFGNAHVE